MNGPLLPSYLARCAVLAMALEVSGTPKPGNIDRDHDYVGTKYEDFLAAAIGVFPVLEKGCKEDSIGRLILEASEECVRWQRGGNTHFGAYILLFPLLKAASAGQLSDLRSNVVNIVKETTVEDAVDFYRAFSMVEVHIKASGDLNSKEKSLDVSDESSFEQIRSQGLTLFDIMSISSKNDMVAQEWVDGFSRSFKAAEKLLKKRQSSTMNDATVLTFVELLAEEPDTLVVKKYDTNKAIYVQGLALDVLEHRMTLNELSNRLYVEKINPGSTADIIIAGIFIALLNGLEV